ncbi:MAG TPA: hypothetical protein VK146_05525 [Tabrizicola sp.]|nr:hypothetical protein [Tabrizicola sp.]
MVADEQPASSSVGPEQVLGEVVELEVLVSVELLGVLELDVLLEPPPELLEPPPELPEPASATLRVVSAGAA